MLVLFGAIRLFTGGAPTGALSESFRELGRGGIEGIPGIDQLPWSLLVLVVVAVAVAAMMRRPFGRTLLAVGDNPRASRFSGARVRRTQVTAFLLSGLLATLAAVLLGGYAGVSAQVGQGLEFVAITAVVLGGVVLGGGQGSVVAAMGGALLLQSLFTLFNQLGLPSTARPAVQGVIIIAAVAYAARTMSPRRRRGRARAAA
jgi:ribose transport system permease protein